MMMKELLGFLAGLEDKASWAWHLAIGFTQGPGGGGRVEASWAHASCTVTFVNHFQSIWGLL